MVSFFERPEDFDEKFRAEMFDAFRESAEHMADNLVKSPTNEFWRFCVFLTDALSKLVCSGKTDGTMAIRACVAWAKDVGSYMNEIDHTVSQSLFSE